MKGTVRKYMRQLLLPWLRRKLKKTTRYRYQAIELAVFPGVFHPRYFYSTSVLLDYLETLSVAGERFLEVGAGSGIVAFRAEQLGAVVTAIEITDCAIKGLLHNKAQLSSQLNIIQSDLFNEVPEQVFDCIFINPPYYNQNPKEDWEKAWYCGENFEFYRGLFYTLSTYVHASTKIIMVLSEDCKLTRIKTIAGAHGWNVVLIEKVKFKMEVNYLFQIIKK